MMAPHSVNDPAGLWECALCLHQYDPALGDPEHGIAAGTPFADLPAEWRCPECGVEKSFYAAVPAS